MWLNGVGQVGRVLYSFFFSFFCSSMRNARSDVDDHLRSDAQSKPVTMQLARLLVLLCVDGAIVLGLS